ncbi:MAG: ABC transporter permease [Lachnospiraceae bacterium]|nr:ABC transporter permease [Lachnospiraceae bacterium]
MKILWKLVILRLRRNRTRTAVTVFGIALSAALLAAVATLGVSAWDYMGRSAVFRTGDYYVSFEAAGEELLEELKENEDVSRLGTLCCLDGEYMIDSLGQVSEQYLAVAAGDEAFYESFAPVLTEGRMPENSSEVLLTEMSASNLEFYHLAYSVGEAVEVQGISYTIVGIVENESYDDLYEAGVSVLFTVANGETCGGNAAEETAAEDSIRGDASGEETADAETSVPACNAYVKTASSAAAVALAEEYGEKAEQNETLLSLYGIGVAGNVRSRILGVCAVLILLLVVSSALLIRNSFALSVTQQTKELGLLAGIGATRRQIRRLVRAEGLALCLAAIPGVLLGYGIVSLAVRLRGGWLLQLVSGTEPVVAFRAVLNIPVLGVSVGIAVLTVWFSSLRPAQRAARTSPMEAIRQNDLYRPDCKTVKGGRRLAHFLGMPGLLAGKYYHVSRGKYRPVVVALAMSLTVFVSAAVLAGQIQASVTDYVGGEDYDFEILEGDMETLRSQPAVEQAAYVKVQQYLTVLPEEALSDESRTYFQEMVACNLSGDPVNDSLYGTENTVEVSLCFLEDAVLRSYLEEQGIDPEPYFREENPTALVCSNSGTGYAVNASGEYELQYYNYFAFGEDTTEIALYSGWGGEIWLEDFGIEAEEEFASVLYSLDEEGEAVMTAYTSEETWELVLRQTEEGIAYYLKDPESGEISSAASYTQTQSRTTLLLGARVSEAPFGVSTGDAAGLGCTLVLPLSALGADEGAATSTLCVTAASGRRTSLRAYLNANGYEYNDNTESADRSRTVQAVCTVCAAGFVLLLSLFAVANVFHTISANLTLRLRDFGVLESLGMQRGQLRRMVLTECLLCGGRALLTGILLSLAAAWLIARLFGTELVYPWRWILAGAAADMVIVLLSMLYALAGLRRCSPMEAIFGEYGAE